MKSMAPDTSIHGGKRMGSELGCIQPPNLRELAAELQTPARTVITLAGRSGEVSHIQVVAQTASTANATLSTRISNPYSDSEAGVMRERPASNVLAIHMKPTATEDRTSTDASVR